MDTKMEKIETNVIKLEITVENEKFNEAMKKSYIKNCKKFNVPGFRKGKAPMGLIKKYYGESVFYEDAVNFCCDETYPKVLDENNINPVDYPEIDIVQIGEGKDLIYTAKVTVMPEVHLGKYKGIEVKKAEYPVKDEDVDNALKNMAEKNARIMVKEDGTVEKGNIAVIDFKGFIDDKEFEGGSGTDYALEIGSGTFIDNFEDQLIGLKAGERKDVFVTFPEDYGRKELNGKHAKFSVTVKEIKIKEVPEIDDEFAKEISEFDTMEEVKSDIRKKQEENNTLRANREYEDAVIDAVCANTNVEIPEVMIKKEIDVMLKDFEARLKYQGLDLKSYYEYTGSNEEKVRDYMKESAEKRVKNELVLAEIAKQEKFEASDDEIKKKAEEMAKQYGSKDIDKTVELIIKLQKDYIKADLLNEKAVDFLVENSKAVA